MTRIAVVIPFYQKTKGVLTRCLRSIIAQTIPPDVYVDIIVVDDASPLAPHEECAVLHVPPAFTVTILCRSNGGPGAARNTGLDSISRDTDFVAFIDSDDCWTSSHLADALAGLDGADFYFCDHLRQQGDRQSHFQIVIEEECGRNVLRRSGTTLLVKDDVQIDQLSDPSFFAFRSGTAIIAFLRSYLAHTSTIVYRHHRFAQLRFDADMRNAGEDYLMTMRLSHLSSRVCYSDRVNVVRGRGVNIYDSAVSWNNPDNILILLDNFRCFARANSELKLSDIETKAILVRKNHSRTLLFYIWLRRVALFRRIDFSILVTACREDSALPLRIPQMIAEIVFLKIMRRPIHTPNAWRKRTKAAA